MVNKKTAVDGKFESIVRRIRILILPVMFLVTVMNYMTDFNDVLFISAVALFLFLFLVISEGRKFYRIFHNKEYYIFGSLVLVAVICVFSQIISIWNGIYYFNSFGQHLSNILFFLMAYYLFRFYREDFQKSLRLLSFAIWLVAVAALLYYGVHGVWKESGSKKRLRWPYHHPLTASTCCLIGFWLPLSENRKMNICMKSIYVLDIFLTLSRSSWIGAVLTCFLYLAFHIYKNKEKICLRNKKKVVAYTALFFVFIIAVFQIPFVKENLMWRLNPSQMLKDGSVRIEHAQYVIANFFSQNPIYMLIGHGPDSSTYLIRSNAYFIERWPQFDIVDIGFLSELYEFGIVVFCAILLVIAKAWLLFIRCREEKYLIQNGVLALLGSFVFMFFYDVQFCAAPSFLIMTLSAVTVINYREQKEGIVAEESLLNKDGYILK